MAVSVSVTVTQVREDGSEAPVDGDLAAALAGPVEQFSSMVAWAAELARQAADQPRGHRADDSGYHDPHRADGKRRA